MDATGKQQQRAHARHFDILSKTFAINTSAQPTRSNAKAIPPLPPTRAAMKATSRLLHEPQLQEVLEQTLQGETQSPTTLEYKWLLERFSCIFFWPMLLAQYGGAEAANGLPPE